MASADWRGTAQRADDADPTDGNAAALLLISSFGSLQWSIDFLLDAFLESTLPHLGPALVARFLDRPTDRDRTRFLLALAAEARYSGDVRRIEQTYNRARDVRDAFAHGRVHDLAVPAEGGDLVMTAAKVRRSKGQMKADVVHVTPVELLNLVRDCAWLEQHVDRIVYETGSVPVLMTDGSGATFEYVPDVPPPSPPHR